MIRGVCVSEGIAIGKAYLKKEAEIKIVQREIDEPEDELIRFNSAAEKCRIDLERRYNKTLNILGDEEAEVFNRHLGVFNGSILLGQVRKEIQEQRTNAEYILNEVKKKYASMFDRVADDFLKKKSESIKFIAEQIIKELVEANQETLAEITEPVILVAGEIDSSDIIQLDPENILAIVVESAGKTSLNALQASELEVPSVVDAKGLMATINPGDEIIVDGANGDVIVNPTDQQKDQYFKKVDKEKEMLDIYQNYADRKTVTRDGHSFELASSTDNLVEVETAKAGGAETIGVMSTEFAFLGRDEAPDIEQQFEAYRDIIIKAEGLPVVFRTLSCQADNNIPYIYFQNERNPMMSHRGIRVTLVEREIFITQLQALLKASIFGQTRIVFPMITTIEELNEAKMALEEAKMILSEQGELYDLDIQVGMIIETPTAAMMSDMFAAEVDFLVIGTTNLLQYMNAVDRSSEQVSELYDIFSPGTIRMVKHVVESAHREGTRVTIAGDMTKNEVMIPMFAAMGADHICVAGDGIPKARWALSKIDKKVWEDYLVDVIRCKSSIEVKTLLEQKYYEDVVESED